MGYQIDRATKRQKKHDKAKNGMRISNRGIFTIVEAEVKRAEKIRKKDK